jgi:hypothetical protein
MRKGQHHSAETKQKISSKRKRWKPSEEMKRKISASLKGRKHTAATKQKMSAARKGFRWSKEMREYFSVTRKGKPAPWVREQRLGSKVRLSAKVRAALARRNKARALPAAERKRRRQEISRHCRLKARYGLSAVEYDQMLERQNGVCRICKEPCSTGKRLAVDHDHEALRVRGLLCRRCNRGLGHFTLETLRAALSYLESHQSHQC